MADVEISYNNSTIVSMNDSGTEVLETNGKVCADDITIAYTKSGGGGAVTHVSSTFNGGYCRYVDANGVYHSVLPEPGEPGSPTISEDMISGSMFIVETGSTRGLSFTNATQVEISDHTSSAYLRYTVIFQVD